MLYSVMQGKKNLFAFLQLKLHISVIQKNTRVCQAISLTEKRLEEKENVEIKIKRIISNFRNILQFLLYINMWLCLQNYCRTEIKNIL